MIGKIRKMLAQPVQAEKDWSLDEPLDLPREAETDLSEDREDRLPSVGPAIQSPIESIKGDASYYTDFVQSAIESGGRFGDHSISIRWLRMILAGLQGIELGPADAWRMDDHPVDVPGLADEERLYLDLFREKLTV
jgi:hypothetical protein